MGRKIIFELADIKRHCISTSNIGSTFVGNIKEKIPLHAVKKSEGKDFSKDPESKKQKNIKRSGKSKTGSKKKKRKVSISSASSDSGSSDSETESRKCAEDQKNKIEHTPEGERNGQSSGTESGSGSGTESENSESSSGGES